MVFKHKRCQGWITSHNFLDLSIQSLNMINMENGNDALVDGWAPKCMDCKGLLTDICQYREKFILLGGRNQTIYPQKLLLSVFPYVFGAKKKVSRFLQARSCYRQLLE